MVFPHHTCDVRVRITDATYKTLIAASTKIEQSAHAESKSLLARVGSFFRLGGAREDLMSTINAPRKTKLSRIVF